MGVRRTLAVGVLCCWAAAAAAQVTMGLSVLERSDGGEPITLFYPSHSPSRLLPRGAFAIDAAWRGTPAPGNRRLIVLSPGSGSGPWPMADLARTLVHAGFVVAVPDHEGDNHRDRRLAGPESWKRRPAELSAAIDLVAAHPRFAPLLDLQRVGVYGTSAGGLAALTLAGARWSPARHRAHCLANLEADFAACAEAWSPLRGDAFDTLKLVAARTVHHLRFNDVAEQRHADARVAAVVASVPIAAPIDPASLARPAAAVGLIRAGRDRRLAPRFHVDAVRDACAACHVLADLEDAGHGSLLSPWPAAHAARWSPLLADPPEFQRERLPAIYDRITAFFRHHLLAAR